MSTLEKQNEIINFIGWREINDTEPEIGVRVRQLHLEIPEYDVNKTKVQEVVQYYLITEITFICKISNTSLMLH